METTELLIVGAGLRGIAMAKTYHEVHPKADMIIMDSAETVGGVWAKARLYPGLRANNVRILFFIDLSGTDDLS